MLRIMRMEKLEFPDTPLPIARLQPIDQSQELESENKKLLL